MSPSSCGEDGDCGDVLLLPLPLRFKSSLQSDGARVKTVGCLRKTGLRCRAWTIDAQYPRKESVRQRAVWMATSSHWSAKVTACSFTQYGRNRIIKGAVRTWSSVSSSHFASRAALKSAAAFAPAENLRCKNLCWVQMLLCPSSEARRNSLSGPSHRWVGHRHHAV